MSDATFDIDAALVPQVEDEIDGADAVRDALAGRVDDVLARTNGAKRIVRVSVPVPSDLRPIDWLRAQAASEAVYWSGRGTDRVCAAVGAADRVVSQALPLDYDDLEDRLDARLRSAEDPVRYYGGVRFDASQATAPNRPDERWQRFGTARFVLPRFALLIGGSAAGSGGDGAPPDPRLACTLVLPRDVARADALRDAIARIVLPQPLEPSGLPSLLDRTDAPVKETWTDMVHWALSAFDERRLDKVVLARRVALSFAGELDALHVLQHLERGTPGCFHFAVRPGAGSDGAAPSPSDPTFIGASPERLFRRSGRRVVSEAVAGTRSRGESAQADAALRDELLESEKDRREHAYVEDAIRSHLDALCDDVEVDDEASELELARGRHLHSRIQGTLRSGVTSVDLLRALHPTPAVGGVPQQPALTAIRRQEPFDRGWYAGPVGWIGRDAAEFAVAIRSGLVRGDKVDLFSGAGIVTGSVPTAEWDEIEQKIADLAAALGTER